MTIRNLDGFFAPTSIAVLGPCRHPGVLTDKLIECLQAIETQHKVTLVGIDYSVPFNGTSVPSLTDLDHAPDLVIYLAKAEHLPKVIEDLGVRGTRAVLIPSPGYEDWPEPIMQACREAARKTTLRLIGPGSLGISVPAKGLNALLSAEVPGKGDIAFFSRSGAVLNATLSWAKTHNTGFSSIVSLGARIDVDALAGVVEPDDVVVVAASGTSGAGRSAKPHLIGSEVMGAMSPYGVGGVHRHTPEIERNLARAAGRDATVSFTPTLAPMPRGILATVTARAAAGATAATVRAAWEQAYVDEPFVHLLPEGQWPHTGSVVGSNLVHVQVVLDERSGRVVAIAAEDNLTKGTAGAAVQSMNLGLGLPETTGLPTTGVAP